MKYLSVCSGIEAATVAWHHMGWEPVGFSEIEKFPSQVLAHHYPSVTNYGDMTKFKEWNINESVELLVGGTPCQSFSVAGLRKGLADPRGNLMLTYLAMADHFKPKWLLWENVPGVLSSNRGSDFGALLQGMAQLGYGFAYRVLDAQHFGVPQRRRRVFVVGCLGDWRSAAKVLFESESLCRDITPRRSEGKEVANCLTKSPSSYSSFNPARSEGNAVVSVYENHGTDARVKEVNVCPTMTSRWGTGGNNVPFALQGSMIGRSEKNGPQGSGVNEDVSFTLNTTDRHAVCAPTLTTNDPSRSPQATEVTNQIASVFEASMAVRRLTPIECERLQGFPDNYTNIKENCPDSHRYKALGNSMAVPVMRWIGDRINNAS